ncbi:MAG: DUF1501 domain-containing protein [Planctomycetaceae bacterium]|nr:DUF1501 domain-containing protein [Planctomycetaceae bacterium]
MLTRREFCKQATLISLAPTVPAFLAQTAHSAVPLKDERILVVIQLDGGNDGLNTVVPYPDENYQRLRPKLAIGEGRVLRVSDSVGLNPAMRGAHELLSEGRLAIVQGVGYPNPSKSHEVSMAIWQTARFDSTEHRSYGWIGRALDEAPAANSDGPAALLVGKEALPVTLRGRKSIGATLANLDEMQVADASTLGTQREASVGDDLTAFMRRSRLDALLTAERLRQAAKPPGVVGTVPEGELGKRLALIARLIKSDFGARVYYAVQSGYDTHAFQREPHADLLRELSEGLRFFLDILKRDGLDDRVLVLAFSEFGRRAEENASAGTDHGTAGPVFLAGSKIKPGLHGAPPNLAALEKGDLAVNVDFRQVYQEVLANWLTLPPQGVLKGAFEPLNLF